MMAESLPPMSGHVTKPTVHNEAYFDEPERRRPPITVVGPVAWVRSNLFGSTLDTMLTVVGSLFLLFTALTLLQWSVGAANWYAIIFNMRLFLVGRVETFLDLRLSLLALYIALVVGVNLAAWSIVRARVWQLWLAGLVSLFVIPWLIEASIALPLTYLGAGQREIVSGSVTTRPLERVAFIGRSGEEVVFTLAEFASEEELARLSSFTDVVTNTLRNAARNRLLEQERRATIEERLAGQRLTERQRAELEVEWAESELPPPIRETHQVSVAPVAVSVRASWNDEVLASGLIGSGDALRFTLPQDGWYVLEKHIPVQDESIGLLAVAGVYPIFDRSFIRDGERVNQYVRATDRLLIEGGRPREADGGDMLMLGIIDHQYKGLRGIDEYLRVMVAPFLQQINRSLAAFSAFIALGYFGAAWLKQREERFVQTVRRAAVWLWLALIPLAFILIIGVGESGPIQASDPQLWGGLLLTLLLTTVGIVVAFPIGIAMALGRRSSLPAIRIASTLYIELVRGVPLITLLFMSTLMVPFVVPSLSGPDSAPYRIMIALILFSAAYLAEIVRGGLQGLPPGQEEAGKAVGLPAWRITLHITLPQALRAVIPALVGQFISLYKDTSLVAIAGLIDLTGVATGIAGQTEFQALRRETYFYIFIIYFIFSFVMSLVSRRVEASGAGAVRRE
ncbi:MAG: amino acid ABC transporter permease [Anaerolineaceae bacterium]|nr:amino acid ABC transporter permease [Anaerolineaceae bacterium]